MQGDPGGGKTKRELAELEPAEKTESIVVLTPQPQTLNPNSPTPILKPQTPNPKPQTLNPKSQTLNP
jgi:hypothetical protein